MHTIFIQRSTKITCPEVHGLVNDGPQKYLLAPLTNCLHGLTTLKMLPSPLLSHQCSLELSLKKVPLPG